MSPTPSVPSKPLGFSALTPSQRWQLRGMVWLIVLGALGLTAAMNWGLGQAWPALPALLRHMGNALALYFLGLLPLALVYLRWLRAVQVEPEALLATPEEQRAYEETHKETQRLLGFLRLGEGFVYLEWFLPILAPIGVAVALLMLIPAAVATPFLLTEWMAMVMGELVIEFVLGYALIRRTQVPIQQAPTYGLLFKRSWGYGLLIMFVGLFIGVYQQFQH